MNTARHTRPGFAILLVTFLIALAGMEMFILAGSSNTMLFQSQQAFLHAEEENLIASGLAWTRANAAAGTLSLGPQVSLPVAQTDNRQSQLTVSVLSLEQRTARVRLNTSCRHGRQHLLHSAEYRVDF
jgi:hypothetical protein